MFFMLLIFMSGSQVLDTEKEILHLVSDTYG